MTSNACCVINKPEKSVAFKRQLSLWKEWWWGLYYYYYYYYYDKATAVKDLNQTN